MKHAAEVIRVPPTDTCPGYVVYSKESGTPTGTYHWSVRNDDRPPTLTKITRTIFKTLVRYHTGDALTIGHTVTIWKRGWHHIKGARKLARKHTRKHA